MSSTYFFIFYCIDSRIELNLSKSTQSAADMKALTCQWALLNVHVITQLFPFAVQNDIYPLVSKVHAWCFRVP